MSYDVKVLQPAYEFIKSLPVRMRAKVYRGIDLIKLNGYQLGMPYSKALKGTNGLKELRIKLGTDICRIFYFHYKDTVYVCTSGYVKKEDETDVQQIIRAQKIRDEYLKEHKNEGT
jgi:phage-related protein